MTLDVTFTPARGADAGAIANLLRADELPSEDFQSHLAHFIVARTASGEVVGAVGAEVCGPDALLRSFVVAPEHRNHGIGRGLLQALEIAAADWGVARWWLLTTSAESFFRERGFLPSPRAAAPARIAATAEFRGLCPSIAQCLTRERRGA